MSTVDRTGKISVKFYGCYITLCCYCMLYVNIPAVSLLFSKITGLNNCEGDGREGTDVGE